MYRLIPWARRCRTAPIALIALPGLLLAQPPAAVIQVSPQSANDNTARLAHTGPYTVQFVVSNTGTGPDDAMVAFQCTAGGNVTIPANPCLQPRIVPLGGSVTVNVTFFVGFAGTGSVQLDATPTQPTGTPGTGVWNLTNIVAAGATVTPASVTKSVARGATGSDGFTVQNTTAQGLSATFTLQVLCPTGFSNCSVTPTSTGVLASGASISATVQYTVPTYATQQTVSFEVVNGPEVVTSVPITVSTILATVNDPAPVTVPPSTTGSVAFDIQNASQTGATYDLSIPTCTGVSGCGFTQAAPRPPTSTIFVAGNGGTGTATVYFDSPASGTGTVVLRASFGGTTLDDGSGTVYVANATVSDPAPRTDPTNAVGLQTTFNVLNTTAVSTLYYFTALCVAPVINCSVTSGQSATIGTGQTWPVTVTFGTGATGGTGSLSLSARLYSTAGPIIDTGTQTVTVQATTGVMAIDVATVNPGDLLARGQCLTIAIASAAASECGDLRVVHPLPTVRTMNTWRTPTLVYSSAHAIGWVTIAANLTLPVGTPVPTTVNAALKINTVQVATGSWPGNQWTSGTTRRVALGFSAQTAGLATGVYDYVLEVTNVTTSGSFTATASGKLVVVNRSASAFGAGWWLAGLEEWNPSTAVWVGGDGSGRQYTLRPGSAPPTRVWGAPSMTYPDSIREVGTEFVRQLPDSVWVFFDASGRHVRTRNRQGHLTTFAYTGGGQLQTITLPPAASPLTYTFTYTAGKLTSVVAPAATGTRTVTVWPNATSAQVDSIQDPDGRRVKFGYGTDFRMMTRTDRRGTVTSFQYDPGNRVSQSSIEMVSQPPIVRNLQQASSQGWSGASVALAQVFTQLNGPRVNVNLTSFYLNQYGAPDSIVDAAGQRTRLLRGDVTFLGLVTQLTTVTGHTITATYDARGRVETSSEPSTTGATATTTYQWDDKWDQVTRITNPEGDFTDFNVEPATGNRLWQQDGRGTISRITFEYNANNQLAIVALPGSGDQFYLYDTKGNLFRYTSAFPLRWTYTNNAIGLTTRIQTPTGTGVNGGPFQVDTLQYSLRNEETQRVTKLGTDSIVVGRSYDEEGNLLTVSRSFSPRSPGIQATPLVTSWIYDPANRPTRQTEPDITFETRGYDDAGNLTQVTTRRQKVITMGYDALNRMTSRTLPAISFNLGTPQISPSTPVNLLPYVYSTPQDGQVFDYYPDGQIALAQNKDATVTRGYHTSGRLLSETLNIKKSNGAGFNTYVIGYDYDKNGRRTRLIPPSQFPGMPVVYGYDPVWGALTGVTDLVGNSFGLTYSDRGDLVGITYPGNISQTLGYDADGRLLSDQILNSGGTQFPRFPQNAFRNFTVTSRNGRGQILSSTEANLTDRVVATYTGLGYLYTANLHENLTGVTNNPAFYATNDTTTTDALGNISSMIRRDTVRLLDGGVVNTSRSPSFYTYTAVGRLAQLQLAGTGTTVYTYDAAGNMELERTTLSVNTTRERVGYYAADERLAATETQALGVRTLEEYRYDALGRRVWVRRLTRCQPVSAIECVTPSVRRTIWDGTQELAEIQAPYDTLNAAVEEMDTGYPLQPYNSSAGSYGDPNPFYGRVVYGPGLAVDQPLSVTRYEYRDFPNGVQSLTWPTFTWQVYWNYQGAAAYGTLTTGAVFFPYQQSPGQQACPTPGVTTQDRCVLFQWPLMRSAYDQNRGKVYFPAWHGTLIQNKRDGSGLEYKRNRVYDPVTGRFAQEDPIGLAGGLNAYGFSASDPVNFSDPFGLCVWDLCIVEALALAAATTATIRFIANKITGRPATENLARDAAGGIFAMGLLAGGGATFAARLGPAAAQATLHGAQRMADPARLDPTGVRETISNATHRLVQADGAQVFIQAVGDRYNVVVRNAETGKLITNLKTIRFNSLYKLAEKYGWHW